MSKHTNISLPAEIVVGKDILELVSSAMYVDPLTIYREYIQNAANSIDEAKMNGVLGQDETGRVDITLDVSNRIVRIRDNGSGVPNGEFSRRLTALGGSRKRGTSARGFRGVGRLAGLGYCQELIFRSRASGDRAVQELRWDCRTFKRLLLDHSYEGGVRDLIREVAGVSELNADGWPEHFYEVELVKPTRIKNDLLLNREALSLYLSQVACVPFSPEFKFGNQIRAFLSQHLTLSEVSIFVDGGKEPIYRPYRNTYSYGENKRDTFTVPEFKVIEGVSGSVAGAAWLLHHGYYGSIPATEGVAGLRARRGNIQIGDQRIFADIFPEARFATWTIGELHVVDDRVIPNGRRDDFEQNAHYSHLIGHLGAIGDRIARLCRSSSAARNRLKVFEMGAIKVDEQLKILEQGALDEESSDALAQGIRSAMFEMKQTILTSLFEEPDCAALTDRYSVMEERLKKALRKKVSPKELANLPEKDRATIQRMISLIYECSTNRLAAKALVDRILARLGG